MRRPQRRLLFNVFVFFVLGVSLYLNMFAMGEPSPSAAKAIYVFVKALEKNHNPAKLVVPQNQKN